MSSQQAKNNKDKMEVKNKETQLSLKGKKRQKETKTTKMNYEVPERDHADVSGGSMKNDKICKARIGNEKQNGYMQNEE